MGNGELPHLLSEPDSVNFLPVPFSILGGCAVFWNEIGAVLHYGSKGIMKWAFASVAARAVVNAVSHRGECCIRF